MNASIGAGVPIGVEGREERRWQRQQFTCGLWASWAPYSYLSALHKVRSALEGHVQEWCKECNDIKDRVSGKTIRHSINSAAS